MKTDNQHLDFLISQYVDGTLDAPNRKHLEQQLLLDPTARQLHKDHHDVQDLLDDFGSRIPLIDWNEFDKKLSGRLEEEVVAARRSGAMRRWLRPLAAAAALLLAASVGYSWHAWTQNSTTPSGGPAIVANSEPSPQRHVNVDDRPLAGRSSRSVNVVDAPAPVSTASKTNVDLSIPSWSEGVEITPALTNNNLRANPTGSVTAESSTRPETSENLH